MLASVVTRDISAFETTLELVNVFGCLSVRCVLSHCEVSSVAVVGLGFVFIFN